MHWFVLKKKVCILLWRIQSLEDPALWTEWTVKSQSCSSVVLTLTTYHRLFSRVTNSNDIWLPSTSFSQNFKILSDVFFFSLFQRKPGKDDLLPTAGQERALPQLWGWGLASTQWRRSVIRGQEGSTQGRELLFPASFAVKRLYHSLWVWFRTQVLITSVDEFGII